MPALSTAANENVNCPYKADLLRTLPDAHGIVDEGWEDLVHVWVIYDNQDCERWSLTFDTVRWLLHDLETLEVLREASTLAELVQMDRRTA